MNDTFDNIIEDISDDNFYSIWTRIFPFKSKTPTSEKIKIFGEFFEYGMKKNAFLEYDINNNTVVFSRDAPSVVVERIFYDLKELNLPEEYGDIESNFIAYAITKSGWAVLKEGTYLFLPD